MKFDSSLKGSFSHSQALSTRPPKVSRLSVPACAKYSEVKPTAGSPLAPPLQTGARKLEKRGGSKLQVQGQGWRNVCAGNTFRPTTTYLSKRRELRAREGKSLRRTDLGKSLPFPRFKSLSFALYHFHLLDLAIWISFGPCARSFSSNQCQDNVQHSLCSWEGSTLMQKKYQS